MSNCWICTSFVAAVAQGAVRVKTGHGESATASTRAAVSQQREMGEKGSEELVPCKQVLFPSSSLRANLHMHTAAATKKKRFGLIVCFWF